MFQQYQPVLLQHRFEDSLKCSCHEQSMVNSTTVVEMELTIVPPRLRRPSQGSNITRFHLRLSVFASLRKNAGERKG
jgi:hypothetical protein